MKTLPKRTVQKKNFKTPFKDDGFNDHDHVWYSGDFTVAPSHGLDIDRYLGINNSDARNFIKIQKTAFDLFNIWHEQNPIENKCTVDKQQV